MATEYVIEISKECSYCDKPPTKLVQVRIGWNYRWEEFVCKYHVSLSTAKAYEKRGVR